MSLKPKPKKPKLLKNYLTPAEQRRVTVARNSLNSIVQEDIKRLKNESALTKLSRATGLAMFNNHTLPQDWAMNQRIKTAQDKYNAVATKAKAVVKIRKNAKLLNKPTIKKSKGK